MKTLVVVCHPNLNNSIVTKARIEQIKKSKFDITLHNLYECANDNSFNIEKEHQLLAEHNRIILLFPVFWFNVPPLLKRWIDQVFLVNWAYGSQYALEGKEFGLAVSLGGPASEYVEEEKGGLGTVNQLFKNMKSVALFTKMKFFGINSFFEAAGLHNKERLESTEEEFLLFLSDK